MDHKSPAPHLLGSAVSAVVNFPLWKAAAIGQSGFVEAAESWGARMRLVFGPPYKGVAATIFGMTWARAAIFYGSDRGRDYLLQRGAPNTLASSLPPIGVSALVQLINQPLVRCTIMLQDPASSQPNVASQLVHLYRRRGLRALWHGSGASVLKTVPKYASAIWVKDAVAALLPPPNLPVGTPGQHTQVLCRSATKSAAAGIAGAALTNPLDVIRNEMFKTEHGFVQTIQRLREKEGIAFMSRGIQRNIIAVAVPIGMTIFLTDLLVEMTKV